MRYSSEEKLKIVEEARLCGNIVRTARKYSISDSLIHAWIKKFSRKTPKEDLSAQVKQLKKQLADRELENAILKDLVKKTVRVWEREK